MFGCQQVLIKSDKETQAILEYLCSESNDLYNCAVYYASQMWFKTGKFVSGFDLTAEMKTNRHFSAGYASSMQQTCINVGEAFKSLNTATFGYINADCNGATNILTKVKRKLGLDLSGLIRGVLTAPNRIRLWLI